MYLFSKNLSAVSKLFENFYDRFVENLKGWPKIFLKMQFFAKFSNFRLKKIVGGGC